MRRALLALVSTVAGLVLVLSFRTHSPAATASPPSAVSSAPAGSTTVTGRTIDTQYGPVQVRLIISDGKIVDVQSIQLPQGNATDLEIASFAVPQLREEALAAQSAHIDVVSGATYTSEGYIASMQSALDQAKG